MTLTVGNGRTLTVIAVGFLVLDGFLLGLAGLWTRDLVLMLLAGVLLVIALLVVAFWRRQLQRLEEIASARQEMREEARALRELVKSSKK